MILEAEEEDRDFGTVYRRDYVPKRSRKLAKLIPPLNFPPPLNALNGPYKERLNSLKKNDELSPEERTEDLRDNLTRVRCKFPHLATFFPEHTPDEIIVEREQKKNLRTIYQVDYSKNLDDFLSLRSKRTGGDRPGVSLPEDWIIPETIQRHSYRNPREMVEELVGRNKKMTKPMNNLDPNYKEREILRISTGVSEYGGVIGATGDQIIREKLHGIPLPVTFQIRDVKGPDSIRSDCTVILETQQHPVLSNFL